MRGGISNQDVNAEYGNFLTALTPDDVGKAVCVIGNNEVGLGADGNEIVGKLVRVEKDGAAVVQVGGFVDLPYAAVAAPTLRGRVVGDGTGKVKAAAAGAGRGHVTCVDATATQATLIL
jgi:hypothetical protein